MRVHSVLFSLLFFTGIAGAQAPVRKAAPTAAPKAAAKTGPAFGTLAQVMRGIFFPNANILFDVQTNDPTEKKNSESGSGATSTFANIYTGWQVVENAAVALEEAANIIVMPGRVCENGKPVPVQQADFVEWAQGMRDAAKAMYKAAETKNRESASDATNDVAGACENCHTKYRDTGKGPRCTP